MVVQSGQRSIIEDLFRIHPDEARPTAYAFVYLFTAIGAFTIARTARTALFLEIPNYKEAYPLVIITTALTISLSMFIYSRFERVLRRDQTNAITLVVLILVMMAFRMAMTTASPTVYWLFYVWAEVFGAFLVIQFWTFMNEIFHARQAKRLFAIISGGGVLSNIPVGWGVRAVVPIIGTENLIFLVVICLLICLGMIRRLGEHCQVELTRAHIRTPYPFLTEGQTPALQPVFATKHVRLIASAVVLTYFASTLISYQFTIILGESIADKEGRTIYMASLFLITGIVGALIQLTVTARLLERFGVLPALLLLPVLLIVGVATLIFLPAFIPALWAAGFLLGSEKILRYTINDSTLQLMYLPVSPHIRGRAKAFIEGILKEASKGAAGLLIFFLFSSKEYLGFGIALDLSVNDLGWLVLLTILLWVLVIFNMRREYLSSLVQTLARRRVNFQDTRFQISDEDTVRTLNECLVSPDIGKVMNAIELLPSISPKLLGPVEANIQLLLTHDKKEIRALALQFIQVRHILGGADVAPSLNDPSALVRAAAITTYCTMEREQSIKPITPRLTDPNPKVRASAIASLVRYGGLDGILACADHLKELLTSDDPKKREYAAWILGEIGVQNFYHPLKALLEDPSEDVQLAAVKAAGALANPNLIPHLLSILDKPRLQGAATRALANYGESIEDTIENLLEDKTLPHSRRASGCRVLARLPGPRSTLNLTYQLLDDSIHVRTAAASSLQAILRHSPNMKLEHDTALQAIYSETKHWLKLSGFIHDLEDLPSTELLRDALEHRLTMVSQQILTILSLKYHSPTIESVRHNLNSRIPATRANAIEVLDNLLDKQEKLLVIPVLEEQSIAQNLEFARQEFGLKRLLPEKILEELIKSPDPWINTCAALAIGQSRFTTLEPLLTRLLASTNAVCRETGVLAISALGLNPDRLAILKPLLKDPVERVRLFTQTTLDKA